MRESGYQAHVVRRLYRDFPECEVIKLDVRQGLPDLLILHKDRWAMLEVKISAISKRQPNQEWYVARFNNMSYASFIYPENEEEVFGELQRAFASGGESCVPER